MTESEIQLEILEYLKSVDIFCFKINNVGKMPSGRFVNTMKGISDVLGLLPNGKFLAIEIKTKAGFASEHQIKFIDEVNKRGGLGFIARSKSDVEEKIKVFL